MNDEEAMVHCIPSISRRRWVTLLTLSNVWYTTNFVPISLPGPWTTPEAMDLCKDTCIQSVYKPFSIGYYTRHSDIAHHPRPTHPSIHTLSCLIYDTIGRQRATDQWLWALQAGCKVGKYAPRRYRLSSVSYWNRVRAVPGMWRRAMPWTAPPECRRGHHSYARTNSVGKVQ